MNNLIRLSKTGIEYGDYAWNFLSGCSNNIDGKCRSGNFNCWAYSIVQRFSGHYPRGFKPIIYLDAFISPIYLKKPSRILCAFMGDICDNAFNPDLPLREQPFYLDNEEAPYPLSMTFKEALYETMKACPQHRFYLLTALFQKSYFQPISTHFWNNCSFCSKSGSSWGGGEQC